MHNYTHIHTPPPPTPSGPVMIFGEPGLEKDRLAAMIHYGSVDFRTPMVKVDCGRYSSAVGSDLELELFGRGAKKGLLEWLEYGTLLINNVHLVCGWGVGVWWGDDMGMICVVCSDHDGDWCCCQLSCS